MGVDRIVKRGFTLIELLVVIAIVAILAAILFPVFAQVKASALASTCLSNLRQRGVSFTLYLADYDDRMPDRRDLKTSLGYHPWIGWPPSDPRSGWADVVLQPYEKGAIGACPVVIKSWNNENRVVQSSPVGVSGYWMWRFDRTTDPVSLDNFWGKTPDSALADLQAAGDPIIGNPQGVAEVELAVDPYFPKTIPSVPANLKGLAPHGDQRNRLFLDLHAKALHDHRTRR